MREVSDRKTATVEQDYLRRFVLKEKETEGANNIDLIEQTVEFALGRGYDVILEGILYFPRYGDMLRRLVSKCPDNYFFYLDVSLDETLKRHLTKPDAHEFGEKEMRQWYKPNQLTHFESERIIPQASSIDETVSMIRAHVGL